MSLETLNEKILAIKQSLIELTGKSDVQGQITFKEFKATFVVPAPFKPTVRFVARKAGLKVNTEGLWFQANSIRDLDEIMLKIEEFEAALALELGYHDENEGDAISEEAAQGNVESADGLISK